MSYELNENQRRFAEHYAEHGKQADAYRFAYAAQVNAAIANERGRRLMRNAAVREHIEELRGSPLPPAKNVRDPRAHPSPRRASETSESDTAEAVKALAAVVACGGIPPAERLRAIDLLRGVLSDLAGKLGGTSPLPCTDGVRGLPAAPNCASLVGVVEGCASGPMRDGRH
jgi:hypothetical protein